MDQALSSLSVTAEIPCRKNQEQGESEALGETLQHYQSPLSHSGRTEGQVEIL